MSTNIFLNEVFEPIPLPPSLAREGGVKKERG